jgi:hypothetical protein
MTLVMSVNKKHITNVAFINGVIQVIISIVVVSNESKYVQALCSM